jgi:TolA-binding protein
MVMVGGAALALVAGAVAFLVTSSSKQPRLHVVGASPKSLPLAPGASDARSSAEREDGPRAAREPAERLGEAGAADRGEPAQAIGSDAERAQAVGELPAAKPSTSAIAEKAKKLYDQGVALLTRKRNREARDLFIRCLDVDSSFAPCHLMLGSAAARLGQAEIGAQHYEMFLRLSPTAPEAPKVRAFLEDYKHTKKRDSN